MKSQHREKLDALRDAIRHGIDSGPPRDFDPDAFLVRMHTKADREIAARRKPTANS